MFRNNKTGEGFDIDAAAAIAQLEKERNRQFTIGSKEYERFECISIMYNYRENRPLYLYNRGFIPSSCVFTRVLFAFGSITFTLLMCKLFIEGTKEKSPLSEAMMNTSIYPLIFTIFTILFLNNVILSVFALNSDKFINIMRFRNIIADERYMIKDYQVTIFIGIIVPAINAEIITVVTEIHPFIIIAAYIMSILFYQDEFIELGRYVNTFFPSEILKRNHPHE